MWVMSKNVQNLPFKDKLINEEDAEKITFPLETEIFDIYLKNEKNGICIPYTDRRFFLANEEKAEKGDVISFSFIPKLYWNICIDLFIEDIYSYSGTNIDYGTNHFNGINISVTTGGETLSHKPHAKYRLDNPWCEIISVEANIIYLTGARYIKKL